MTPIVIDTAWVAGLGAGVVRMGAFAAATPFLRRRMPIPGWLAFAIAIGLFLAAPLEGELTVMRLIDVAVMNAAVGISLGFLTGLIFYLFAVAGAVTDLTSGLAISAVFDPTTGSQSTVFSRFFDVTAVTIFMVLGGHRLLVTGMATSVEAVPLDGTIEVDPNLANVMVGLVGRMMIAGVEIAMPALAALFMTELVLGIAARMMPQANIFLVGLPAKLLLALAVSGLVIAAFPTAMDGVFQIIGDTFVDVLRGFGAS